MGSNPPVRRDDSMMPIPNEIIKNFELSDDAVLAYVFVKIHTYSMLYDSCLFTTPHIVDQIRGYTNSHSVFCRTTQAIEELAEKGILKIAREDATNWRIFMQSFKPIRGRYVLVDPDALRSIMDCRARGKATVLRYYLLLLANISPSRKVCIKEEGWFAKQLKVSPKSIATYNEYLETLKLIYVYRPAEMYQSNVYGRYENMRQVEKEGEKICSRRRRYEKANEKRRYAAMYRSALRGCSYDIDTLKNIVNHLDKKYDLSPLIDKIKEMEDAD